LDSDALVLGSVSAVELGDVVAEFVVGAIEDPIWSSVRELTEDSRKERLGFGGDSCEGNVSASDMSDLRVCNSG